MRHFVSLLTQSAHSGHPVDINAGFCQCVHPIIVRKISELVSSGVIETIEIQGVLDNYVQHNKQSEHGITAHSSDRAFHPLPVDIKNHVDNAKQALELSKLDQENLHLKIQVWKKKSPESLPYIKSSQTHNNKSNVSQVQNSTSSYAAIAKDNIKECMQSILWVHQGSWQKDLLVKYGNTTTLIDVT